MTSLTDFSETITPNPVDEETQHSGRAPLAPLIDHLTDAAQPLAFQVVFRRKPDWSKQAQRRAGALLAGTDPLLQKILGFESSGGGERPPVAANPHDHLAARPAALTRDEPGRGPVTAVLDRRASMR